LLSHIPGRGKRGRAKNDYIIIVCAAKTVCYIKVDRQVDRFWKRPGTLLSGSLLLAVPYLIEEGDYKFRVGKPARGKE
jgi:hypothetical protein